MSSASDVVCATKRWEMDLRELMYVSVSTSCTVATATAMTKLVWNLVKCEHFHTNLNFDELCKITCSLIPWPNRHKAGTLCKGWKQTMEAIFPIIFFCQRNHLKTLSGCLITQDGVVAISVFWTVLCSNVLPKSLNKQLDVPRVNCLVCAHTRDHVHTCCMLVAVICKMISLI